MKFFKSPLFIAGLAVFLGVFAASIVFMQIQNGHGETKKNQSGHASAENTDQQSAVKPDAPYSPAIKNVNLTGTRKTIEKLDATVSFVDSNNKFISSNQIPLYTITKLEEEGKQARLIAVEADGDLCKSLIDRLNLSDIKLDVDKEKTLTELENAIRGTNGDPYREIIVKVVTKANPVEKKMKADATKNMTDKGFNTLLAKFRTNHPGHADDAGRNVNLSIAAKKINGLVLKPKEKFSFNKVVGERSAKNGFKPAGCISAGRVIPGLGGGICQVSTTLYRAVLLSGAKIDERHNHSIYDGIEYAQRGLDAAVAWGYKDFKFTNALDIPLLFKSKSGEGWVEVEVWAERKPFESIELATRNEVKLPFKTEKRVNKKLKDGEVKIVHPGVDGYTIEAFRTIIPIGGVGKEVRLSKDRYLTYNRIEERNK